MLNILKNSGPWGSWNPGNQDQSNPGSNPGANDSGSQKPKNNSNPRNEVPDFVRDISKKVDDFLKEAFGGGSNKGSNNGGKNGNVFKMKQPKDGNPKSLIGLVILGIAFLWLASGIYKVDSNENAVVLYFGKYYKTTTPGLNYYVPYPFGKVIKKSVTTVNTEEFGFSSNNLRSRRSRNFDAESLMLTGDENIVDIEFQVQWQIADIKDYVFNIASPQDAIRKSAESAMREIIARTPIANALSDGKSQIELQSKILLQEILDYYGAGVRVVLVQLRRVDPPSQVIAAFRDVQTAKADKEKEINQAQSYSNDIIPRARGRSSKMKEQAEAYAQQVISNAEGEAGRFLSVYWQYTKAKRVTRSRLYLETMEEVYANMDKIILDKNASKSGIVPYLSLNELNKNSK
jgi:membrane protease subunit HflK